MENYFLNFPIVNYEGYAATNIMLRPIIRKIFKDNFSIFYSYNIPQGHRADKVAFDLYGKAEYVWIIYLFNDIIDPYYDWPLSEENLTASIIEKYGTVEAAVKKIVKYRSNWYNDDTHIDPATYAALSSNQKKFWKPNILPGNRVFEYVRKDTDIERSTNQILTFNISLANSSVTFQANDYVNQGANNRAQIAFSNSSSLVLQHVVGSFSNTVNVVGSVSNATATIVSAISTQNVVASDEVTYFSAVTAYDVEVEKNAERATIKLVRPEYVPLLETTLNEVLHG